jgi:hypothetical protein
MRCHKCKNEAIGICRFCGRAVCKEHHSKLPFILTIYVGAQQTPKTIVVADALFCGECKPQTEPIEIPEFY